MEKDRIENGKIYHGNGYGTTYIFEIIEKIPSNYEIWNIPPICDGEYIPICLSGNPDKIDTKTLKAIKLQTSEVEVLRRAAGEGDKTIKKIKRTLSRSAKTIYMARRQEKARLALPILERISE